MAFTETQWIDMRTERLEMLLDKHVVDLKDERSLNSASNSPPPERNHHPLSAGLDTQ